MLVAYESWLALMLVLMQGFDGDIWTLFWSQIPVPLFSDDDLLPLEDWVFNTEAHPLPVIHKSCLQEHGATQDHGLTNLE